MIRDHLRHWVIIDLHRFRGWATDSRIRFAELIDNHDGTYGKAFDLRTVPPDLIVAASTTMSLALNFGMSAVEPLPSGPPRVIRLPPDLSELIARYGRYDLIPPQAWEQWDRQQEEWRQRHKFNQNICKGENK